MPRRQSVSSISATDAGFLIKHPETLDDFLLFRLYNLSKLAAHGVGLMLHREAGISRRDSRILAYVGKHPGVSLTQLARIAELDTVVTSRCVAHLVARGMLVKTRMRSNKRLAVLALSEVGKVTYEQARCAGRQYNIDFSDCLSDREAGLLDVLLTKLEHKAKELTEREISKMRNARH